MYFSQQKALQISRKTEMYNPQEIEGFTYNFSIPPKHRGDYQEAIAKYAHMYNPIVEIFHACYPNPPFSYKKFLEFLRDSIGITATVIGFNESNMHTKGLELTSSTKGTWHWNNEEKSEISIFLNTDFSTQTHNSTVIHEAIHAIQDFDHNFHEILGSYPIPVQLRIAERIAEKTAISILLPPSMVDEDKQQGLNPYQVALKYEVSTQMASYEF